jgi:hypothetical protein
LPLEHHLTAAIYLGIADAFKQVFLQETPIFHLRFFLSHSSPTSSVEVAICQKIISLMQAEETLRARLIPVSDLDPTVFCCKTREFYSEGQLPKLKISEAFPYG